MPNPCHSHRCIQCCVQTEMQLTNEDVRRIHELGFADSYYIVEDGGWLLLKNFEGRCVFNDGRKCLIYDDRPEGCRSYPVVYVGRPKLDDECPHHREFSMSKAEEDAVKELALRMRNERKLRKSG